MFEKGGNILVRHFFNILYGRQMVFLAGCRRQEKVKDLFGRKYCLSSVTFLQNKIEKSGHIGHSILMIFNEKLFISLYINILIRM